MDSVIQYQNVEYLVDKYLNDIIRIAYSYLHNLEDAQDAAQQAFITYLQKKPEFESENHAKAWLIKVSVNICRNILRSPHNTRRAELTETLAADNPIEMSDEEEAMLKAVQALKQPYQEVIHLYYYEDYSTEEIAEFLNIPSATVRSRLARARAHIKKSFKGGQTL